MCRYHQYIHKGGVVRLSEMHYNILDSIMPTEMTDRNGCTCIFSFRVNMEVGVTAILIVT